HEHPARVVRGARRHAQGRAGRVVGTARILPEIGRRSRGVIAERRALAQWVQARLDGDIDLDAEGDGAIHHRIADEVPTVALATRRLAEASLERVRSGLSAVRWSC